MKEWCRSSRRAVDRSARVTEHRTKAAGNDAAFESFHNNLQLFHAACDRAQEILVKSTTRFHCVECFVSTSRVLASNCSLR